MAERFTRLFQLGNDLYLDGSPVIICAGALLNDTVTGAVIAQIKYQNISEKKIVAAKVQLCAYDAMRAALDERIEYSYHNLDVSSGSYWGGDKAIILPDRASNSFEIIGFSVAFDDGTCWKSECVDTFISIPASPLLVDELHDMALVEQYCLETTPKAKYVPIEYGNLWRCACGCINQGAACTGCNTDKTAAFEKLSNPLLSEKVAARLAIEIHQKAEKQAKERKWMKNTAIILTIVAVMAVVGSIYGLWIRPNVIEPARKYKEALALYQNGEYKQAESRFAELGSYRDSEQYLQDIPYRIAEDLLEKGKYEAARNAFLELGDYRDSADRAKEMAYLYAQTLQADGDYITARKWFEDAEPYNDSIACVERLNGLIFEKGVKLFEQGSYTDALHYLKEAPATDEIKELIAQAETAMEYLSIVDILEQAGDTVDSTESLNKVIEAIQRYQEIDEKGNQITGMALSEKTSRMVEMYRFYADYKGKYTGEYGFSGDISVEVSFSNGRSEDGYFFIIVSGTKNYLSREYMANGSLESKHYRFQDQSTIIYSNGDTEFVYSKRVH